MRKLIYKIKNNKLLAGVTFSIILVFLFDLFVIIFDIIQIVALSKNAVIRFSAFYELNIIAGILSVLVIASIFTYFVVSRRKLKVQTNAKIKSR